MLSCCRDSKTGSRFSYPSLNDVLVRRLASRFFEEPHEVIRTDTNRLSNPGNSYVCAQLILNIFDSTHQFFARQPTIPPFQLWPCWAIFAQEADGKRCR